MEVGIIFTLIGLYLFGRIVAKLIDAYNNSEDD